MIEMNKNSDPLVAICIPVYEKLNLLKRLESSILKQTYKKYIVIITDDSNSDEIELYIKISKFKKLDDFIYIHNDHQMGPCANTNKCIRIGIQKKASLIKVMHQDDFFSNVNSLEKMVQKIEKDKTDAVFVGDYEIYKNKKSQRISKKEDILSIKKDLSFLFRANILGAPSVMMFRAKDIEFDPSFSWLLDVDFYLRLLFKRSFSYIYEPLVCIGHDGDQLTDFCLANPNIIMKETLALYQKYKWLHTKANKIYLLSRVMWFFKVQGNKMFLSKKILINKDVYSK